MKGLGERIRSLRKTRRLTLVEVARKTGIDQATLSRIENGVMTGTIQSHMKIADTLGINLPTLYENVIGKLNEAKETVIKRRLETFSHSSGAVAELLTTGILQKKMMPILLRIKPNGRTATEEFTALSERFVYVLKGSLEVTLGKDKQILKTGECLYVDASRPHYFSNPGKTECCAISVMTPVSL